MTCWAVIPIKATGESKSRLAEVLPPAEREELVRKMLSHVIETARAASRISRICLVGPPRPGLPDDIPLLDDPGQGLNPAVQSALAAIASEKPDRVVIIAGDLPGVTPQELNLLAIPPENTIAIAPDRHETGTNAISLPLPAAEGFTFAFGPDSFAKHRQEAQRLGLEMETILSKGLERDVDEPADLADAERALRQTG